MSDRKPLSEMFMPDNVETSRHERARIMTTVRHNGDVKDMIELDTIMMGIVEKGGLPIGINISITDEREYAFIFSFIMSPIEARQRAANLITLADQMDARLKEGRDAIEAARQRG